MISYFKSFALYLFPFILVGVLSIFEMRLLTEVTGNTGGAIWFTVALFAYYAIVIFLNSSLKQAPFVIMIVLVFSLIILPIRQNISVIDYAISGSQIYWVERSYTSGTLRVFVAKKGGVIKARKLYQDNEITHEAFLELNSDGLATLVYSRKSSEVKYHRQDLPHPQKPY